MSPKVLIVYGTSYGQTAKIAGRIRDHLEAQGFEVALHNAKSLPKNLDPATFDAVVVGGSIVISHHQKEVFRFVRKNLATLQAKPTAFFSVSGSAGGATERNQADARRLLEDFLKKVGWTPTLTATIGGAIAYTRYNWFLKLAMRRISRMEGGSVDMSRDYEMTDWGQVEGLAGEIGGLVGKGFS